MSMQPAAWPEPDPQIAAAIGAKYRGKRPRPLAVLIRDQLGQWLGDEDFAAAFGARGKPGWSPSRLALVTVLQRAENLTDRQAESVRTRIDWQYLLGLPFDDPGFDHTVLSEFRSRVADAGLEEAALDALLERLVSGGLVTAGGKQRTDSTHVTAAVAALNRLELAGESVRAALEALAAAHPAWLAQRICVPDFERRYGTPMTSWRPPVSAARRDELAVACARDGYALLAAVYDSSAPAWLREMPAVDVLRRVLLQNYTRTITGGKEVIKRREKEPEGDGLPPGHARIATPYDLEARWGVGLSDFRCEGFSGFLSCPFLGEPAALTAIWRVLSYLPFPACRADEFSLSLAFLGVLVFRGVSRVFPARAGCFPAMCRYAGVFLAGGGGLVQARGGEPEVDGEVGAAAGPGGRAGAGVLGGRVAGQAADHPGGVGEQAGQLVSVVRLDEDPLVGQGDRHPAHRFPLFPRPGRSHGVHRDPAGPFRVEGGQRLPPARRDRALDQVSRRIALVVRLARRGLGCPGRGPLVLDIDDTQPQQLHEGIIVREMTAGLDDLPHLPVKRLAFVV